MLSSDDITEDCPEHREEDLEQIDEGRIQALRTKLEGAAEAETENCGADIDSIKSTPFYQEFKSHTEVRRDLIEFFILWARGGDSGISNVGEFSDVTEHIVSDFDNDLENDADFSDYMNGNFSNSDERDVKHSLVQVAMLNGDGQSS
ncbi:hypothetical protein [Haloplanus sp. C73]|uniref:hypothetical protein n=1 Tax=Haloplanus sp. C73 TaxID=3421641 RepID=UPI003EB88958